MVTIGVQKAKLGSTVYYIGKMRAGELIDNVGFAAELPEWSEMTADEKMQRQPDITRVINEIVPYVIEDPDRFFNSLIIDVFSGYDELDFEPVSLVAKDLPKAYQIPMQDMGFLTLPGKERLIALDGQHRLLSLRIAIRGVYGLPAGAKVPSTTKSLEPHPELADEEVSIILVEHKDNQKIRKIFNKVNKYARQTSRGDNIITSDDDIYAVIARRLFSEGEVLAPIGKCELVNWKSNTLSQRSKQLTTVSALYTIAETVLKEKGYSAKLLPSQEEQETSYAEIVEFWQELLDVLDVYKEYLELTKADKPVSLLREQNLLMKPVTQMALAHVAANAKKKGILWNEIVQKLNKVDWSFDNKLWFNILIIGSAQKKMITGKESIKSAGMIISYLVMGDKMSKSEIADVHKIIKDAHDNQDEALPQMV